MTEAEKKALEQAVAAAGRRMQDYAIMAEENVLRQSIVAHARTIEQHEAFKREVSDALSVYQKADGVEERSLIWDALTRFIIAKPDPLVEVLQEISGEGGYDNFDHYAYRLRSALEARGLEVHKIGEGE